MREAGGRADGLPVRVVAALGRARAADARVRRVRQERWKAEVRASRTAQR